MERAAVPFKPSSRSPGACAGARLVYSYTSKCYSAPAPAARTFGIDRENSIMPSRKTVALRLAALAFGTAIQNAGGAFRSSSTASGSAAAARVHAPPQQRMEMDSLREPFLRRGNLQNAVAATPSSSQLHQHSGGTSSSSLSRHGRESLNFFGGDIKTQEIQKLLVTSDGEQVSVSPQPSRPLTATEIRRFLLLKYLNFDGNHLPRTRCAICRESELTAETSVVSEEDGEVDEVLADTISFAPGVTGGPPGSPSNEQSSYAAEAVEHDVQGSSMRIPVGGEREHYVEDRVEVGAGCLQQTQGQDENEEQEPARARPDPSAPHDASSGRRRRRRKLQTIRSTSNCVEAAWNLSPPGRVETLLQPMAFPCGHAACSSCVSQWRTINPQNCRRCHLCNERGADALFRDLDALSLIRPVSLSRDAIDDLLALFLSHGKHGHGAAGLTDAVDVTRSHGRRAGGHKRKKKKNQHQPQEQGEGLHVLHDTALRVALWEACAKHVANKVTDTPAALVLQADVDAVLEDTELRKRLLQKLTANLNSEVNKAYSDRIGTLMMRSCATFILLQIDLVGLCCVTRSCAPTVGGVVSSLAGAFAAAASVSSLPSLSQVVAAVTAGLTAGSSAGCAVGGLFCVEIGCLHYKIGAHASMCETNLHGVFHPPGREELCAACIPLRRRIGATPLLLAMIMPSSMGAEWFLGDQPYAGDTVIGRGDGEGDGAPSSSWSSSPDASACCCCYFDTTRRRSRPFLSQAEDLRQMFVPVPTCLRAASAGAVATFDFLCGGSCRCDLFLDCLCAPCDGVANCLRRADSWQPYVGGRENFLAPRRAWDALKEMRQAILRVEDLEEFMMGEDGIVPMPARGEQPPALTPIRHALDTLDRDEARSVLEQQLDTFRKAWPLKRH